MFELKVLTHTALDETGQQKAAFLHLNNIHTGICKKKNSTNHRMHVNILECWKGNMGLTGLQPSFSLSWSVAGKSIWFYQVNNGVGKAKNNADMSRTELYSCFENVHGVY